MHKDLEMEDSILDELLSKIRKKKLMDLEGSEELPEEEVAEEKPEAEESLADEEVESEEDDGMSELQRYVAERDGESELDSKKSIFGSAGSKSATLPKMPLGKKKKY